MVNRLQFTAYSHSRKRRKASPAEKSLGLSVDANPAWHKYCPLSTKQSIGPHAKYAESPQNLVSQPAMGVQS